jgi:chemotaxis protein MotC
MADFAAGEARRLSLPEDTDQMALATLYSGMVNIPSDSINAVLDRLAAIPDKDLTPKDKFLREAARVVAQQVLQPPDQESLTQVRRDMVDKEYRDHLSDLALDPNQTASTVPLTTNGDKNSQNAPDSKAALDQKIGKVENFVSSGRSKLQNIDALLQNEGN